MIKLTNSAIEKLTDILIDSGDVDNKLRVFVQGGGCSGFSYGFTLDTEISEDDFNVYFWQHFSCSRFNKYAVYDGF